LQLQIFIFCGLIAYVGKINPDDTAHKCNTHLYSKTVGKYEIRAQYDDCDPKYKSRLKIYLDAQVIYSANPIDEFEFYDHAWPSYLHVSENTHQLLLVVNDRPLKNYILCLTFSHDTLVSKTQFHLLENPPKDFDNDGLLEYAGFRDWMEQYSNNPNDPMYFHPIQYVELGKAGFQIDTTLIRKVNTWLYHKIPDHPHIYPVYKPIPRDTIAKYLNGDKI